MISLVIDDMPADNISCGFVFFSFVFFFLRYFVLFRLEYQLSLEEQLRRRSHAYVPVLFDYNHFQFFYNDTDG